MNFTSLLIANRGEIAIRIIRAAASLGLRTVAIYSEDDATSLHTRMADEARPLNGAGIPPYLDTDGLIQIAKDAGCDAIHPGYGFLAESAEFARRCAEEGITYVGPSVENLDLFGDKGRARAAAEAADIPIMKGIDEPVSVEEAHEFFASLGAGGAMMIKAIAGGGGRGTRVVTGADEIDRSYRRAQSEAKRSFGNGDLYVEELVQRARHVEVQILGDTGGTIVHLGERECTIQRRHQKVVEIAPAPNLSDDLRTSIIDAALRLAKSVGYTNLGTFEFLVYANAANGDDAFAFIEANARLQVEHTVTEEVTGVDIVQSQIRLAAGESIADLGLDQPGIATPRGYAIQVRVNMETFGEDGTVRPSSGTLTAYEAPGGPGVRTDGFCYSGYKTNQSYDSLLAKVVGHSPSSKLSDAIARTSRALSEFRIAGVETNIPFLQNVLSHPDFVGGQVYTRFVDDHIAELIPTQDRMQQQRFMDSVSTAPEPAPPAASAAPAATGLAGANIDSRDPLALFNYDSQVKAAQTTDEVESEAVSADLEGPSGSVGMPAPIQGTILSIDVSEGDEVHENDQLVVMEAMKMEHVISADRDGIVRRVAVSVGETIRQGYPLVFIEDAEVAEVAATTVEVIDPDHIRSDLEELIHRHSYQQDENRPEAVARRRKWNHRTARENIADLCDADTFMEFGPLAHAAQWSGHDQEWLRINTPADGLICGIGTVNGGMFDDKDSRVLAISYDYSVLAGTQGGKGHYKQDRVYELAHRFKLPVVLFSEGGGGRPGGGTFGTAGTGGGGGVGVSTTTFTTWSQLSGLVPMVGITSGRCFAGNTALLACCDVIIATEGSTVAMGGPAMIEGGGLGIYTPEEVGPMSFQVPNGVVDILVKDEEEAVAVGKKYLSYFQGPVKEWEAHDQRTLRHAIPENRVRMYDMREIIETMADKDSVLEIRKDFGIGMITSFIRIEGHPLGVIANNPAHLAGAIDSDGADKGARFLQLCDAFDIPVITLIDCPGIMVGPEVEETALVRHCARLFNAGANVTTPMFGVVVRKAYGLGGQAMCGGGSLVPFFTVAWPTAEFAGMNIEGGVKLGYRREFAAIDDPQERLKTYDDMVARGYERARAVNAVSSFGIDDVIDPSETRRWMVAGLRSLPPLPPRTGKKHPYVDTW